MVRSQCAGGTTIVVVLVAAYGDLELNAEGSDSEDFKYIEEVDEPCAWGVASDEA
jgi:hypothetical protein